MPKREIEQTNIDGGEVEKSWPQVMAIFVACLAPFISGVMLAWTSPFIVVITEDKINYNITEDEASYFTVLPPMGAIVSSLIFFKLNDIIGRKKTLMFYALPQFLFFLITMFAKNIYLFYVARFISGISDASLFSSLPMFIGEVATPSVRGTWGNLMTFMFYVGTLAINVVGSFVGVKEASYIFIGFPVGFVLLMTLIPESPYFYVIKNNHNAAKESLRWLRRKDNIEPEFQQIRKDVERQISESGTFKDLFTIKSNRRALLAACFLRFGQHMSGLMVFQIYTQFIFKYSQANLPPELISILYSGILAALNPISGIFLDIIGRKKSFQFSLLLSAFPLLLEGVYFYLSDHASTTVNLDNVRWLPVFGIIIWATFFSIGIGSVPTLMLGELFSASIKSKGLALSNVFLELSLSFQAYFFYFLSATLGMYFPFMVFGFMSLINAVLTMWIIPETKGKTLEQIQQKLKGNKSLN